MKKLILLIVLLYSSITINAQNGNCRTCDTERMWEELLKNDPQAAIRREQLKTNRSSLSAPAKYVTSLGGNAIYRIPIVFHVMHEYGSENISKAQIEDAVRILNLTFQKLNPDTGDVIPLFQTIFSNPEIEFYLPSIDPNGNCTDGITRHFTTLTSNANDNVKSIVGWPSDRYLNIWVVKKIASGAAGYAYYPGASSNIDGIVMLHDYTGSIGTSNGSNYSERSLAHEVGHYLNLPHTWGSSNTPGLASNCSIDDGIGDTPNTIGTGNFSCNTAQSTCGFIDNVQNYMDYASCHKMFTEGQKTEMHNTLLSSVGSRDNLWSPSNLIATGTANSSTPQICTPVADFSSKPITVCQGSIVNFKDVSWNGNVTARQWDFPGGIPSIDTSANPAILYNVPGQYDVILTISNGTGSDVITRTALVNVLPSPGSNVIPYSESFESLIIPGNEWAIINSNNNNAWTISSAAAATGTKSVRLVNQTGNSSGSVDELITPTYDLSNVSGTTFSFKVAYAPKATNDSSTLRVSFSSNCGLNWTSRYLKEGVALATASNTVGTFIPNSTQWRTETVNLAGNTFSGKPSVRAKFEFTNYQGNNIYIDDIQINGNLVGINENLAAKYNFASWPNPSKGNINVKYQLSKNAIVNYELFDIAGKLVDSTSPTELNVGSQEFIINAEGKSGVYILKMNVDQESFQQRITFIQ